MTHAGLRGFGLRGDDLGDNGLGDDGFDVGVDSSGDVLLLDDANFALRVAYLFDKFAQTFAVLSAISLFIFCFLKTTHAAACCSMKSSSFSMAATSKLSVIVKAIICNSVMQCK